MGSSSTAAVLTKAPSSENLVPTVANGHEAPLNLQAQGLINPGRVHANLTMPALLELALARREGLLTDAGAFVAYTGTRTGRSPQDRYLVNDGTSAKEIHWGAVNRPMER